MSANLDSMAQMLAGIGDESIDQADGRIVVVLVTEERAQFAEHRRTIRR